MLDARWTRVLLVIALLQLGLGGILAVTMAGDGSDDDGSVATDSPTDTFDGGSGTAGDGADTIPSTDPAFGTEDPGDPVGVTTQPPGSDSPPAQDTRPQLPASR